MSKIKSCPLWLTRKRKKNKKIQTTNYKRKWTNCILAALPKRVTKRLDSPPERELQKASPAQKLPTKTKKQQSERLAHQRQAVRVASVVIIQTKMTVCFCAVTCFSVPKLISQLIDSLWQVDGLAEKKGDMQTSRVVSKPRKDQTRQHANHLMFD